MPEYPMSHLDWCKHQRAESQGMIDDIDAGIVRHLQGPVGGPLEDTTEEFKAREARIVESLDRLIAELEKGDD